MPPWQARPHGTALTAAGGDAVPNPAPAGKVGAGVLPDGNDDSFAAVAAAAAAAAAAGLSSPLASRHHSPKVSSQAFAGEGVPLDFPEDYNRQPRSKQKAASLTGAHGSAGSKGIAAAAAGAKAGQQQHGHRLPLLASLPALPSLSARMQLLPAVVADAFWPEKPLQELEPGPSGWCFPGILGLPLKTVVEGLSAPLALVAAAGQAAATARQSGVQWAVAGVGKWSRALRKGGPGMLPVLAVLQWWFFNVLLILLNKWIFQVYRFTFPLTLTAAHFGLSFVGAFVCIRVLGMKPLASVTWHDVLWRVLPMAVVTNLNVCLGNVSLRWIPVTFMQTVKAFTPATTVLLQRVWQGKHFDPRVYAALVPIVGGVTLASTTELSFHLFGFLAAVTSTVFTSVNSILAETLLKGHVDMDSINTVYYMAPLDFLMLLPLAAVLETSSIISWFVDAPIPAGGASAALPLILLSGVLAFGLNFSLFYAIQATSAMTFNVAGNLKVALAMLLGWLIFQNPMSALSTAGCAITVLGCTWYGYVMTVLRQEQQQEKERRERLKEEEAEMERETLLRQERKQGGEGLTVEEGRTMLVAGRDVEEDNKDARRGSMDPSKGLQSADGARGPASLRSLHDTAHGGEREMATVPRDEVGSGGLLAFLGLGTAVDAESGSNVVGSGSGKRRWLPLANHSGGSIGSDSGPKWQQLASTSAPGVGSPTYRGHAAGVAVGADVFGAQGGAGATVPGGRSATDEAARLLLSRKTDSGLHES